MLILSDLFLNCLFQSTLPQGERRESRGQSGAVFRHFNPRSRKGSDSNRLFIQLYHIHFNPRSRKGSDDPVRDEIIISDGISIHAPARGATISPMHPPESDLGFQSTLPQGERLILNILTCTVTRFQSTLPQGERP